MWGENWKVKSFGDDMETATEGLKGKERKDFTVVHPKACEGKPDLARPEA